MPIGKNQSIKQIPKCLKKDSFSLFSARMIALAVSQNEFKMDIVARIPKIFDQMVSFD